MRRLAPLSLALLLAACSATPPVESPPLPLAETEVQLLAINDFHGRLDAPMQAVPVTLPDGSTTRVPAGGAAYLAGAINGLRTETSITVAAGDLIGATPIASALFLDEPTIEALDLMGLQYSALGNHEFDKGPDELLRIINGGCEKYTNLEPCRLQPHDGADFTYFGANVTRADGSALVPTSTLHDFGSVQLGIIGLPLDDTPLLVAPNLVAGLNFADEADSANALVADLKAQGADSIVLLIHEGAYNDGRWDDPACTGLSGPVLAIHERLDPAISLIVSGHTHNAYDCSLPMPDGSGERLLTSAGRYGAMLTDIRMTFEGERLVRLAADNLVVQGEPFTDRDGKEVVPSNALPRFAPDPRVAALVERTVRAAEPMANRIVGTLSGPAPDHPNDFESPAANLIADAQLAATRAPEHGGAQLAFINGGGVRTSLVPGPDGAITYGQIFEVQPFGNTLMTVTLSGAQLKQLLEQQFVSARGEDQEYHLIPSSNFSFAYDLSRPQGDRIVSMTLDGQAIDPAADYRVTANNFIANGGDGYSVLKEGRNRTGAGLDLDAVIFWLAEGRDPPPVGRIRKLGE
ncbi:bifunctional metallophosphatase/5'-nucleotidase [Sphingomicrobium lutaoense]|uniref:5'-nucleotidase n=1 Tax=Sphingomicrobium lutaoense TaxID=515949 RepID=A0A839Z161_9SPHN|nr:bifunctional UDP-sugar hydrolase/5'-nucleotidase [Sphingomicrobium lutaoense]MBB3763412.1 5'-nucleotidase [Sphingomicrobium lutaoense]